MIKAIIFDCFGVLIQDPFDVMLSELDEKDPERARRVIRIIESATVGRIGVRQSQVQIASLFGVSQEEYVSKLRMGRAKNVGLLKYAEHLRRSYKTGILSNVAKDGLADLFTEEELDRCFDIVLTSGGIGYAKPNARAYEITANELGLKLDECLMIDDREDYCVAARNAGMQSIKYTTFVQMKRELSDLLKL